MVETSLDEPISLAEAAETCRASIQRCCKVDCLVQADWAPNRLSDFNLWTSGLGVFAQQSASLDRRLASQPEARKALVNLVNTLSSAFEECCSKALEHERDLSDDALRAEVAPTAKPLKLFADDDDSGGHDQRDEDSDDYSIPDSLNAIPTVLQDCLQDAAGLLHELVRLGSAIRKAGTTSRLLRADSSLAATSKQGSYDQFRSFLGVWLARRQWQHTIAGHAKVNAHDLLEEFTTTARPEHFGPAEQLLIDSNVRRRHRFAHCSAHASKLAIPVQTKVTRDTNVNDVPKEDRNTDTSKISQSSKFSAERMSGPSFPQISNTEASTVTRLSIEKAKPRITATTVASVTTTKVKYPAPPDIGGRSTFACPSCFLPLPRAYVEPQRWRKHISEDLCPYNCPFPQCPDKEVLFISLESWTKHLISCHEHRTYWICPICAMHSNNAADFRSHLEHGHKKDIDPRLVPEVIRTGKRLQLEWDAPCPVCAADYDDMLSPDEASGDPIKSHIGRCLHEFALLSLPWLEVHESIEAFATWEPAHRKRIEEWTSAECSEHRHDLDRMTSEDFRHHESAPPLRGLMGRPAVDPDRERDYFALEQGGNYTPDRTTSEDHSSLVWDTESFSEHEGDSRIEDSLQTTQIDKSELQRFRAWIEMQTISSYDLTTGLMDSRAGFVPTSCIKEHFEASRFAVIGRILSAVFDVPGAHALPVQPWDVANNCARVFCILFLIGKAKLIQTFVSWEELFDAHLPFTDARNFPSDPEDSQFFARFYKEQWRFCPPQIRAITNARFDADHVLPIVSVDRTGIGTNSIVYKATIHHDFDWIDQNSSRERLGCYAIKHYKSRRYARESYDRETRAFSRIQEHAGGFIPGLIQFYCSFVHGESYNAIFEYADKGTLEDFFKETQPPQDSGNLIRFWEQLLKTVTAVGFLHEYHGTDNEGKGTIIRGWHQDLKPSNILVLSNNSTSVADYSFKVADLSLAHFTTSTIGGPQQYFSQGAYGTVTYGPPECHRSSRDQRKSQLFVDNSIDIWSLGCVFSEAVVWSVDGWNGVEIYREQRKQATDSIPNFTGGDCFHDGERRLTIVDRTHRDIIRKVQDGTDHIIGQILDRLIADMLDEYPHLRPKARIVVIEAGTIIREARARLEEESVISVKGVANRGSTMRTLDSNQSGLPTFRSTPEKDSNDDNTARDVLTTLPSVAASDTSSARAQHSAMFSPQGTHTRETSNATSAPALSTRTLSLRKAPVVPRVSRERALRWKMEYKLYYLQHRWPGKKKEEAPPEFPHAYLLTQLKHRDHIFLIDDSLSMHTMWEEVKALLETLAYIVKPYDEDGIELLFTVSTKRCKDTNSSVLVDMVTKHTPTGNTDIGMRLGEILTKCKAALHNQQATTGSRLNNEARSEAPATSIYIFTNAVWSAGDDAAAPIKAMIQALQSNYYRKDQVGIQFIRFSDTDDSKARLEALDDLAQQEPDVNMDIVDTEYWDGNVMKMLLGSMHDVFDQAGSALGQTPA